MNVSRTRLIEKDYIEYTIQYDAAESLTLPERYELLSLLNTSYPDWGIDEIFENYPCYQQLYILRLYARDILVASRQVLIVESLSQAPNWAQEIAGAMKIQRFAIGSRAIVHPDFRGQGLGTRLVQQLNKEVYLNNSIETVFGSSTSPRAIELYLRLGAKLWNKDLSKPDSEKTTAFESITLSKQFAQNKTSTVRMQKPLRYVYQY